jgi:hypothetical protein
LLSAVYRVFRTMKNSPQDKVDGVENTSRRKVIRTVLAAAVPASLVSCASTAPQPASGRATIARSRGAKSGVRGKGKLTGKGSPPLPEPKEKVSQRVKWDFDRLIHEMKTILEEDGTDTEAERYAAQKQQIVSVGLPAPRNLNVKVKMPLSFMYGKDEQGNEVVTGMIVQGCMTRGSGLSDDPKYAADLEQEIKECLDGHDVGVKHNHLITSSSSSSSSWGIKV